MTHLTQAIQDAVEKGGMPLAYPYPNDIENWIAYKSQLCLDPAFWRALGVARGWRLEARAANGELYQMDEWPKQQLRLITHLQAGNDIESFFRDLSPQQGKE